ncbi:MULTISPECIES: F0F1 ATP synthase subunit A [Holzapfeliella]
MGEKPVVVQFMGLNFNLTNIISGLIVCIMVFLFVYLLARKAQLRPTRKQNVLERIIEFTNSIVKQSIPGEEGKKFYLFSFVLFLFIFFSNQLGLFLEPKFGEYVLIKSPTSSPLITMTLATFVLLMAFYYGIEKQGFGGYLKNYTKPVSFLLPLNIFEEFSNFLTLALRLYGNIYAGEIVLGLIGQLAQSNGALTYVVAMPLTLLWQGFSVFIGAIQAYVFVTLSMVYISHKIEKE